MTSWQDRYLLFVRHFLTNPILKASQAARLQFVSREGSRVFLISLANKINKKTIKQITAKIAIYSLLPASLQGFHW